MVLVLLSLVLMGGDVDVGGVGGVGDVGVAVGVVVDVAGVGVAACDVDIGVAVLGVVVAGGGEHFIIHNVMVCTVAM